MKKVFLALSILTLFNSVNADENNTSIEQLKEKIKIGCVYHDNFYTEGSIVDMAGIKRICENKNKEVFSSDSKNKYEWVNIS